MAYDIQASIVPPQAEQIPTGLTTGITVAGQGGQQQAQQLITHGQAPSLPTPAQLNPTGQYQQTSQAANDPNQVQRTKSYGGAYAAPVLSQGTHGFRQKQAIDTGMGGYNPVDQAVGDYLSPPQPVEDIVPDVHREADDDDDWDGAYETPELDPYRHDNPRQETDISVGHQNELGIVSSDTADYYDTVSGRQQAASDLGYERGSRTGAALGTVAGAALGVPGLGLLGSTQDNYGDLGTTDLGGNVFDEAGDRFNPITGEQEFGLVDSLNPFRDDSNDYQSYGSGASHVPEASQAGLRSIAGEDSILAAINEAVPEPTPEAPVEEAWSPEEQAQRDAQIQSEIDWFTGQSNSPTIFNLSDGRVVYRGQVYDNHQAALEVSNPQEAALAAEREAHRARQDLIDANPGLIDAPEEVQQPNSAGAPPNVTAGWVDADGDGFDDDGEAWGTHGPVNVQTAAGEQSIMDVLNAADSDPGYTTIDGHRIRDSQGTATSVQNGQVYYDNSHDWSQPTQTSVRDDSSSSSGGK